MLPFFCRKEECPKNHIEHYTREEIGKDGNKVHIKEASLVLTHHKVNGMASQVC